MRAETLSVYLCPFYVLTPFRLGTVLDLEFFGIAGTVFCAMLAVMWLIVAAKTLAGGWAGNLFVSPCIATPD